VSDASGSGDQRPRGGWRSLVTFWAEIVNKLAIPLLTVVGTLVTLAINERNNTRATINQREQAESNLRSNMFSQLINPLIDQSRSAPEVTGTVDLATAARARADRLTLLAELLALNFHEHFELGPLLRYVEQLDGQSPQNQRTLRSVARRVTGRQIAMLGHPRSESCATTQEGLGTFEELSVVTQPGQAPSGQSCFLYESAGPGKARLELDCSAAGPARGRKLFPLKVVSPDCRDELLISFSDLDWDRQTMRVLVTNVAAKPGAASVANAVPVNEFVDFTLSTYSLPFSDNTLLRSGNRFGIYVRQAEPDPSACGPGGCSGSRRLMLLSFLWFPRDFFPPRERPTDFAEVRKVLKLGGDDG
jgi:hypothetical protein